MTTPRDPTTPYVPETMAGAALPPVAGAPAVRVPEPMSVVWQGVEYRAARWDVHGFTLETAIPRVVAPGRGRVFDVTLLIGQGGTRIEMRVQARGQESDEAAPIQFAFVDLERAQAEVLHRIVDTVVAQQAMSLTRLLNETEDTRVARQETGERVRSFRTGFQLTLAGVVLAVAGMMTWSSFATVRARFAAVTVGATSLSVPVAGRISQLSAGPGDTVNEGDILGYVRPSNYEDRQDAIIERRRALEIERAELQANRGTMAQLSGLAVAAQGTDRSRLEETQRLAERRLSVEQSLMASLRSTGLPTASRLRERSRQEAAVLQAESHVLDVRTRLASLAQSEVLAPLGVVGGTLRSGTQTLDGTDLRLAALDEEITRLAERESRAAFGEPIVSPCNCTVQDVQRRVGEWTEPSEQLAVLVGAETATVHALILGENARSIELGDRAQIELADGTSLNGRVSRMNYDAHWRGYAGLQDDVFAADRYARLEIMPERPLSAPVGMVAQVNVHTNGLFSAITRIVGL